MYAEHSQLRVSPQPELVPEIILKQKQLSHQPRIFQNSKEYSICDLDTTDANKQLIFRRRQLFSHYRQYEQWRRQQFSYDPSYYRPTVILSDQTTSAAFYRRRQYRRQFSCVERGQSSRDSQEIPLMRNDLSAVISNTNFTLNNPKERLSFETSECGALTCQSLHYNSKNFRKLQDDHSSVSERCSRSRINSAIFMTSEEKGFDSIEFLRRHGSQSVLCRKAKSAENLRENEAKQNSISTKTQWCTNECSKGINERNNNDSTEINLRRMSSTTIQQSESLSVSVPNSKEEHDVTARRLATNHSAAITTLNVVVGSISIETPPTYLKGERFFADNSEGVQKVDHRYVTKLKPDSACRGDLTDTEEEFIVISTEAKPHEPVHKCSSKLTIPNQSPLIPSQTGPWTMNLGRGKKKVPTAVPVVSVSGPSSADEEELVSECL